MAKVAPVVSDLIYRIAAAPSVDGVWDDFLSASKSVGLCFGIACYLPPFAGNSFQVIADAFPENWLTEYNDQRLIAGDLLLTRTKASTESFHWHMSDWDEGALSDIQRRWYDHNIQRGIFGGLSIFDMRPKEHMVLFACGPDGPMPDNDRNALYLAGREALVRLRELAVSDPMEHNPFTRRERDCLQGVAQGKSDWEVGQVLGISEKTVGVYVERAIKKFKVGTRAQAVASARATGLIAE